MYHGHDDDDVFDFDFEKYHREIEENFRRIHYQDPVKMGVTVTASLVVLAIVIGIIVACCCRRKRSAGQVISTATCPPVPPAPNTVHQPVPAPYPQQQYAPYPTHAPVMPTFVATPPYPPYGNPSPYPMPAPYPPPSAAPSAPDAHALPPSYEQAVRMADKGPQPPQLQHQLPLQHPPQPPYNPHAPPY